MMLAEAKYRSAKNKIIYADQNYLLIKTEFLARRTLQWVTWNPRIRTECRYHFFTWLSCRQGKLIENSISARKVALQVSEIWQTSQLREYGRAMTFTNLSLPNCNLTYLTKNKFKWMMEEVLTFIDFHINWNQHTFSLVVSYVEVFQ